MNDFIRARTDGQKEIRMKEIKDAAGSLFSKMPYSDISLTVIAEKLGWSRANLYKYITTKEEIFLAISEEKMGGYFASLNAAFPDGNKYSPEVIAEVWAGILNASQEYLRYSAILTSIVEKNVTVERLAAFKKKYYDAAFPFCAKLSEMLKIEKDKAYKIFIHVLLYSSSSASSCEKNPLVQKAMERISVASPKADFYEDLRDFILMEIKWQIK